MKKGNAKKLSLNKIQVSRLTDLQNINGGSQLFNEDVSFILKDCPNSPQGGGNKTKTKIDAIGDNGY